MKDKNVRLEDLDKLAYECAIKNVDLEEIMNFITSNETLKYLANLKSKNLDYLKKVFNLESEVK